MYSSAFMLALKGKTATKDACLDGLALVSAHRNKALGLFYPQHTC